MTDIAKVPRKRDGEPGRRPLIDEELADELLDRAQAETAKLLGLDGLLSLVRGRGRAGAGSRLWLSRTPQMFPGRRP